MKSLNLTLGLLITFAVCLPNAEARRDQSRERNQETRIHEGVKSGELNNNERKRLRNGQRRIDRAQERASADGVVTDKEKAHLERMQDHESRKIYRLKHNDRKANQTPEQTGNSQ